VELLKRPVPEVDGKEEDRDTLSDHDADVDRLVLEEPGGTVGNV